MIKQIQVQERLCLICRRPFLSRRLRKGGLWTERCSDKQCRPAPKLQADMRLTGSDRVHWARKREYAIIRSLQKQGLLGLY